MKTKDNIDFTWGMTLYDVFYCPKKEKWVLKEMPVEKYSENYELANDQLVKKDNPNETLPLNTYYGYQNNAEDYFNVMANEKI